jgi:hypothetical protein
VARSRSSTSQSTDNANDGEEDAKPKVKRERATSKAATTRTKAQAPEVAKKVKVERNEGQGLAAGIRLPSPPDSTNGSNTGPLLDNATNTTTNTGLSMHPTPRTISTGIPAAHMHLYTP